MIIDKEQLITLLEKKTGHEREKVENQLEELVKRIQQAAEADKTFEIEGFGTFSMEDEDLRFEPNDRLETEINNKYAGMKPIELIGAFKEPDGDDIPAIDVDEDMDEAKGRVWAFDEASAEKEETSEEPVEASREEPSVDEVEDDKREQPEEPVTSEQAEEKIFDTPESKEEQAVSPEFAGADRNGAESDKEASEPVVAEGDQQEKDIISKYLIAAVVIIAIILSGWVAYDTGLIGAEENRSENTRQASISAQQSNTQEETTSQPSSSDETENSDENISSEPEEELAVGTQEDLPEQEEEETVFGLKGDVNETISGGYTIVVHSLRSIEEAEKRKEDLQESGYRVLISKANVQGTTYYRVGLGQFENVDDALTAVSDIPESFQSSQHHFIKRIK